MKYYVGRFPFWFLEEHALDMETKHFRLYFKGRKHISKIDKKYSPSEECLLNLVGLLSWELKLKINKSKTKETKKESSTSSSNKRPTTLYRGYLHCIGCFTIFSKEIISNNTKFGKYILKLICHTWKSWWNETDDEIFTVFAQFLWNVKFIYSSSHRKLCLVLSQATVCILSL